MSKSEGIKISDMELEAIKELKRLTEESVPRIEEVAFINVFLPLFASDDKDVDLSKWMDVAGTIYSPVDVVKGDEVLFRVPALARPLPMSTNRRGSESIFEMMETLNKKNSVSPFIGKAFLEQELDRRVRRLAVDEEDVVTWNNIFARYNYPPLVAEVEGEASAEEQKSDPFEDGFEEL